MERRQWIKRVLAMFAGFAFASRAQAQENRLDGRSRYVSEPPIIGSLPVGTYMIRMPVDAGKVEESVLSALHNIRRVTGRKTDAVFMNKADTARLFAGTDPRKLEYEGRYSLAGLEWAPLYITPGASVPIRELSLYGHMWCQVSGLPGSDLGPIISLEQAREIVPSWNVALTKEV